MSRSGHATSAWLIAGALGRWRDGRLAVPCHFDVLGWVAAAPPGGGRGSHAAIVVRSAGTPCGALPSSTTRQGGPAASRAVSAGGRASPHPPILRLDSGPPRRDLDPSVT